MSEIAPGSAYVPRGHRADSEGAGNRGGYGRPSGRRGGMPTRYRPARRKVCAFCVDKVDHVDYKDAGRLRSYISERAKILKSRHSGCCAKHQRMVSHAIKRAREIALLPFVNE